MLAEHDSMERGHEDDAMTYRVVVNHEGQYSIWPAERDEPFGWEPIGKTGNKSECLEHIDLIWTDMRPNSLRRQMAEADCAGRDLASASGVECDDTAWGASLVDRLSQGKHQVEAWLGSEDRQGAFGRCVERGYLRIRFPQTGGGTVLGLRIDGARGVSRRSDAATGASWAHIESELTLNGRKARCVVDLDLVTFCGEGCLVLGNDPA
jgi:uncharacterized protein YbdZ (MbtH family)